ncbi:unnamed protein product [Lupinus luteus]|uniref:Proteasome subunit beta type-4 n=1 Tax=Lupinus luteus TaxID=3873 RepID=A0AAV1W465_LUPLU
MGSVAETQRTLYPYVTGSSVVAIKYKDGILMAADMGGSYGSTLRYKSIERLKPIGKHSLLGASGEISDFQEILRYLDELILYDNMWDDGNSLGPKEVHNYLTQVMYNRRNKFNPLWNSLVLGGVKNGQKYLGTVNMIGINYEDNHVATGLGNHLARPILRDEWHENLTFEDAVKLLEKCMRVLLYRDRSAVNKIQISKITEEGATLFPPFSLKTNWEFSAFRNPTAGAEVPASLSSTPICYTNALFFVILTLTWVAAKKGHWRIRKLLRLSAPSRSYRRRVRNRLLKSRKPTLNQAQFQLAISQIPPRFTPEELFNVLTLQNDPLVCLELFHWASQQPRFRHDVSTYHVTIKKLGAAKMYQEMDDIVNQVLAVPSVGSEAMYNTIIYYFTEARKLTRAVNIFKHMKSSRVLNCKPSIRTYHILFSALLSRGHNTYINYVYMGPIRSLFRQMVNDGIEPDIFSLNLMIKGYVLSLHVNDALRIFHQMGGVYDCKPNTFTYDYLIHGLCAQGRTNNAKEICHEMKTKGFIPSSKSYNSLVSALALGGEVDEAVNYLWEMIEKQRSTDFITYRTILDEICRRGRVQEAMKLLQELQEKDLVEGHDYRKLRHVLEDDYGNPVSRIGPGYSSVRRSLQSISLGFMPAFAWVAKINSYLHGYATEELANGRN